MSTDGAHAREGRAEMAATTSPTPMRDARIGEIRAALYALPAPPWLWSSESALVAGKRGPTLLTAGRDDGKTGGPPRLLFWSRTAQDPGPVLRSALEIALTEAHNPIARWLADSGQFAVELLAELDRLRATNSILASAAQGRGLDAAEAARAFGALRLELAALAAERDELLRARARVWWWRDDEARCSDPQYATRALAQAAAVKEIRDRGSDLDMAAVSWRRRQDAEPGAPDEDAEFDLLDGDVPTGWRIVPGVVITGPDTQDAAARSGEASP